MLDARLLGLVAHARRGPLVGRLSGRRQDAESLAAENAQLYAEQRTVAQTLQHSLLAEALPARSAGLEFGASYVAGVEGIDIGGDWYDVVRLDQRQHPDRRRRRVGSRSRGGDDDGLAPLLGPRLRTPRAIRRRTILTKLSGLASVARDGHFATVLCGLLDVTTAQSRSRTPAIRRRC